MTVLTPDGHKHYTSGVYRIAETEDSISDAGFTTSLTLIKNVKNGIKGVFTEAVANAMVVTADEIQALSPLTLRGSSGSSSGSAMGDIANGSSESIKNNVKPPIGAEYKSHSRNVTATGYCPCKICCEQYSYEVTGVPNKTASGTTPTAGRTLAVDPKMIPYGTEVIIKGSNGYDGTYVAEDKGGAIKEDGRSQIDMYFNTHQEALKFGVRNITIYW